MAFIPFVADSVIKTRIANLLKQDEGNLPGYWDNIVSDAHEAAINTIVGILSARGYTLSQIQSWDRGPEFEKSQALFEALTRGAGLGSFDDKWVAKLDRCKDLKTVAITSSGAFVAPQGTGAGVVGFGYLDETLNQLNGLNLTGSGFKNPNTNSVTNTQW